MGLLIATCSFGGELQDLERTVEKWKPAFYMHDFEVHLHLVSLEQLRSLCEKECVAASLFDVSAKRGEIFVLRRKDYSDAVKRQLRISDVKADQRNSVVHEMIHCLYRNMAEESAVSVLAAALRP